MQMWFGRRKATLRRHSITHLRFLRTYGIAINVSRFPKNPTAAMTMHHTAANVENDVDMSFWKHSLLSGKSSLRHNWLMLTKLATVQVRFSLFDNRAMMVNVSTAKVHLQLVKMKKASAWDFSFMRKALSFWTHLVSFQRQFYFLHFLLLHPRKISY